MTDIPETELKRDRPWRMILIIAAVAVGFGVGLFIYSLGYSSGTKSVDQLQSKVDNLNTRLTRANKTQNNLSEAVVTANNSAANQANISACRQHRSQFEKILDSNQELRLVQYIGRVVNKPPGVDLATNPTDIAAFDAYAQASSDYQKAVLAPDKCL